MSTPTTDAQHARAIVQIINEHVALERETNVRITDHIEAYFTDKVSRPDDAALREIQSLKDQISNMERNFNAANTAKDPAGTGPQMDKMAAELRKAVQERDAFRDELRKTQHDQIRHAGMIDSLEKQKEALIKQRDEAKARHSDLAETSYPEIEKLKSELESVRAALHIVTRERDTGSSNYTRVCNERDDERAECDKRMTAIRALEAANKDLAEKLQMATDECNRIARHGGKNWWVKFSGRKPTLDDADAAGNIFCVGVDGVFFVIPIETRSFPTNAMWRPADLPVPIPPFVRWKRSLTDSQIEDFGGVYNLDEVWKSISKFIAENPI